MCELPRRTSAGTCCVVAVLLSLSLLATDLFGKTKKQEACPECQPLVEMLIPEGRAMLDELTLLAEAAGGTIHVTGDANAVLAELPLATAKTLSRRGIAVVPAGAASDARQRKDGENCANAIPVEAGIPYSGQTTFAAPEAWHSFAPDESGLFLVSLAGSSYDTVLTILDACDGNVLAFNDDDGFLMTSELTLPLEAGNTYIILIEGFWWDFGNYELLVEPVTAAPGTSCFSAVPVERDTAYESSTTFDAPEKWHSFTPTASGNYVISLKRSQFDTILIVYDRCAGLELAYNDDTDDAQSRLGLYLYEGQTYVILVAGWLGEFGLYQLEVATVTPPPHDTVERAIAVDPAVPFEGSTDGATSTLANSTCSLGDSRDVWHSYRPGVTGHVRITVDGTGFDSTVAVFDEFRGAPLACNDDIDMCGVDSSLSVNVAEGKTYLIRVAGYDGTTGPYTLTVEPLAAAPPETPHSPNPPDRAQGVSATVVLSWANWNPLPEPTTWSAMAGKASRITVQGIYGQDDRLDEYQIEDQRILAAGEATVLLVNRAALTVGRGGYRLADAPPLAEAIEDLCPDEPFRDQPSGGLCSGFLVAPDLIATAGHCQGCAGEIEEMAVLFGYVMADAENAVTIFLDDDIYYCQEIVAGHAGAPDWALIRLDRPVTNHLPLRIRRAGFVREQQRLLVVGHPLGLPRKYDSGGTVRDNWLSSQFSANLDTFGGNSGAPVFNFDSMLVEGILVAGNADFAIDPTTGCVRSSVCLDSGCPLWEDVIRTTVFSNLVPSYTVRLGTGPDQMAEVDAGSAAPQYRASALEPGQTYYWQIVAQSVAGQAAGPVWSFTTAP